MQTQSNGSPLESEYGGLPSPQQILTTSLDTSTMHNKNPTTTLNADLELNQMSCLQQMNPVLEQDPVIEVKPGTVSLDKEEEHHHHKRNNQSNSMMLSENQPSHGGESSLGTNLIMNKGSLQQYSNSGPANIKKLQAAGLQAGRIIEIQQPLPRNPHINRLSGLEVPNKSAALNHEHISTLQPSVLDVQQTIQERTTSKLQHNYGSGAQGNDTSIEGSSIMGPREIKVELNSRKPTFEIIGKANQGTEANRSTGISPNVPFGNFYKPLNATTGQFSRQNYNAFPRDQLIQSHLMKGSPNTAYPKRPSGTSHQAKRVVGGIIQQRGGGEQFQQFNPSSFTASNQQILNQAPYFSQEFSQGMLGSDQLGMTTTLINGKRVSTAAASPYINQAMSPDHQRQQMVYTANITMNRKRRGQSVVENSQIGTIGPYQKIQQQQQPPFWNNRGCNSALDYANMNQPQLNSTQYFSEPITKSSDSPDGIVQHQGISGGVRNDFSLVLSMMSHQHQKDIQSKFFEKPTSILKSMMQNESLGNGAPINKITKDIRKLEKHYFDRYKHQGDHIKFLNNELNRIKELTKKFLTPEQLLQIDVMHHQNLNLPQKESTEEKVTKDSLNINIQQHTPVNNKSRTQAATISKTPNQFSSPKQKQDVDTFRPVKQISKSTYGVAISDVHQLYQDFYLTDLKQEIDDTQKLASQFRLDSVHKTNELERLRKENADLKSTLKRYRQMIGEQESKVSELTAQLKQINSQPVDIFATTSTNQPQMHTNLNSNSQVRQLASYQQKLAKSGAFDRQRMSQQSNSNSVAKNQSLGLKKSTQSQQKYLSKTSQLNESLSQLTEDEDLVSDQHQPNRLKSGDQPVSGMSEALLTSPNTSYRTPLQEKLETLSRYSKMFMESLTIKQFFVQLRLCFKQMFNYSNLYLMLKGEDVINIFKKKEFGITHTLTIDTERFEGVIPDGKKEVTQNFQGFQPEFNKRELTQGFLRNNAICWPITVKSRTVSDKEDLLMMIQMNGQKGAATSFNQQDVALMSLASKIIAGALMKCKSDRMTAESLNRSYNIFETFRNLLAERNHAVLNKLIRVNLSSLFKFKHVGILFAEKSREPFNPLKDSLYSLIIADDANINSDFRLTDQHLVMHSAQSGLTGLSMQDKGKLIIAKAGQFDKRFSFDVDNYLNVGDIYNMVVGSLVDSKGHIRGVIHMINKDDYGDKTITEEDRQNIEGVLPTLGEVIKSADECSELSQICCSLQLCLGNIVSSVPSDMKDMSQAHVDLKQLENIMKYVDGQVTTISQNYQKFAFIDRAMCMTVFDGLRDKEVEIQSKIKQISQ